MFAWLVRELAEIKTPKFHLVNPPGSAFPEDPERPRGASSAHRAFVRRFGDARLYRFSRTGYLLGVFATPQEMTQADGTPVACIGWYDGDRAYTALAARTGTTPVFEAGEAPWHQVADGFEEWIESRSALARKEYSRKKWAEILRGPRPFSPEELSTLEARRLITWEVVGIEATGEHAIKVSNRSVRQLPRLTIGARSKDGRLNGGVILKTEHVRPGETSILHVNCYKDLRPPEEIELFDLPEPGPEDRDYYAELRGVR